MIYHAMAFFSNSWIVHLDLIPCSQVYSYSYTHTPADQLDLTTCLTIALL